MGQKKSAEQAALCRFQNRAKIYDRNHTLWPVNYPLKSNRREQAVTVTGNDTASAALGLDGAYDLVAALAWSPASATAAPAASDGGPSPPCSR